MKIRISAFQVAVVTLINVIAGVYIFKPVFEPKKNLVINDLKSEVTEESSLNEGND